MASKDKEMTGGNRTDWERLVTEQAQRTSTGIPGERPKDWERGNVKGRMTDKFPELEKDMMSLQGEEAHQVLSKTNKSRIFNKESIFFFTGLSKLAFLFGWLC